MTTWTATARSITIPSVRARFRDRRRVKPLWLVECGMALGFFSGSVAGVAAQGVSNVWTEPSTILAIVGIVFAGGITYQLVTDTRKRLDGVEHDCLRKADITGFTDRMDRIENKLDRLIERKG